MKENKNNKKKRLTPAHIPFRVFFDLVSEPHLTQDFARILIDEWRGLLKQKK